MPTSIDIGPTAAVTESTLLTNDKVPKPSAELASFLSRSSIDGDDGALPPDLTTLSASALQELASLLSGDALLLATVPRLDVATELMNRRQVMADSFALAETLLRKNDSMDLPAAVRWRNDIHLGQLLYSIGSTRESPTHLLESIDYLDRSIAAAPSAGMAADLRVELGRALLAQWECTNELPHLQRAIEVLEDIDRELVRPEQRPRLQDFLGAALLERAEQENKTERFTEAIRVLTGATEDGPYHRLYRSERLGRALRLRARVGRESTSDRDKAIVILNEAVDRDSPGTLPPSTLFSELGATHWERFVDTDSSDLSDLGPCIISFSRALLGTPSENPRFVGVRLQNLLRTIRISTHFLMGEKEQLQGIALLEACFEHLDPVIPGGRSAFLIDIALLLADNFDGRPAEFWIRQLLTRAPQLGNLAIFNAYDTLAGFSTAKRYRVRVGDPTPDTLEENLMRLLPATSEGLTERLSEEMAGPTNLRYRALFDYYLYMLAERH